MNKFTMYTKFTARMSLHIVTSTAKATVCGSKAFAKAFDASAKQSTDEFYAREAARSDSPLSDERRPLQDAAH